jgi:hypothetical protein
MSGAIICQMTVNRLVGNFKIRILKGAKKPDNIKEGNGMNKEKELLKIRRSMKLMNQNIKVLSRQVEAMKDRIPVKPQEAADEDPGKE